MVYYHGHRLPAPYTISARFELMDGDTLWEQIYVNGYPILPKAPNHTVTHEDSMALVRNSALGTAASRAHIPKTASPGDRTRAIAAAYASVHTFVDSVHVVADYQLDVYWKHSATPMHFLIRNEDPPSRTEASKAMVTDVRRLYAPILTAGGALVFHYGVLTVPPSKVALLERDVAILHNGTPGTTGIIKNPLVAEEFRHPKPLDRPEE